MKRPAHIGCSGWNYRDWRGRLYPDKLPASRWLECYAQSFSTVEVNSTFYRLAKRDAVARWVDQTPDDFVFACKSSRYLTHMKRLTDMDRGVSRFYEAIEPLVDAGKLGPVVWQLADSFRRDDERLEHALEGLPPGRHCFELRHPTWYTPDVYALLREHGVALAIGDHPARPHVEHEMTTDWTLVRLHYGRRGRRGNYSSTEIATWARRIAQWRRRVEVFVYFNNDWEGFAPRNARELEARLGR